MTQAKPNSRQARWCIYLAPYDLNIEHRPGEMNPAGPTDDPDSDSLAPGSDREPVDLEIRANILISNAYMPIHLYVAPDDVSIPLILGMLFNRAALVTLDHNTKGGTCTVGARWASFLLPRSLAPLNGNTTPRQLPSLQFRSNSNYLIRLLFSHYL